MQGDAPITPLSITLTPAANTWPALVAARSQLTSDQLASRRALGLPVDQPIVISGHQAAWWHAGILAKHFALTSLARRTAAHPAWLIVDHDASPFSEIRYPVRSPEGQITTATWATAPDALAADQRADCALASLPAFSPSTPPTTAATPDAIRGMRAIYDALSLHTSAPNVAAQIAGASASLLAALSPPQTPTPPAPSTLFATSLLRAPAMQALIDRMAADPAACVKAYNAAVARHSVFGIAPLAHDPARNRYELPLWRIPPRSATPTPTAPMPRQRVYAHTLPNIAREHLAPRALLMSGFVRAYLCDLFIHGTGGGATGDDHGYDRIAADWLRDWLGLTLSPSVVATATLLLDLGAPITVTSANVRSPRAVAHELRHHPRRAGNAQAQQTKDALVAQIRAATDPAQRRTLYKQMHALLDQAAITSAPTITAATAEAKDLAARFAAEAPLRDRTWPWPLHPRPSLLRLARAIDAAFDAPSAATVQS